MFNLLRIKGSGCFDQIYGYETLGFSCGCLYWCETRGMTYDPLSGNRWIDALFDSQGLDRLPENLNITLPDLPVPDLAGTAELVERKLCTAICKVKIPMPLLVPACVSLCLARLP